GARPEDLAHLEEARLTDQGHAWRFCRDQALDVGIRLAGAVRLPRAPESTDFRASELDALEAAEVLGVSWIRSGEPALDPLEAQLVELLRDAHLVLDREGNPLHLAAIAQ